MTRGALVAQSLRWYWRTNAAVVAGVAVAVSVLAGSLLVGDSVRASLRRIALERLGRTDAAILGTVFFREQLGDRVREAGGGVVADAAPLLAVEGLVTHAGNERRAGGVQVFGVDERFWRFHGAAGVSGPDRREAYLSPALARELGAAEGDGILVRVRQVSEIPAGVLQGRRDDSGQSFRASAARILSADALGEFSLSLGQGPVRSVFVPLDRLQRELRKEGEANVVVLRLDTAPAAAAGADAAIAQALTLQDAGLTLNTIEAQHALSLESRSGFIDRSWQDAAARAAREAGARAQPVLTYIANTIRVGDREIPYSVVTGVDFGRPERPAAADGGSADRPGPAPVWLNEWAARELAASAGDAVTLEYFIWSDEEGLKSGRATFEMAGVVPMSGAGGDRSLTPEYPGMTDVPRIGEWDPPFPVDLGRIQPRDERYWDEYRAAPKALVAYDEAQRLWGTRFGRATSIRLFVPPGRSLDEARQAIERSLTGQGASLRAGLNAHPVRERALGAARGATDFGEYFFYFSFFLFVSGLILAVLFFRLGIEQRTPQIGLLQAMGFTARDIRRLFLAEGGVLAGAGTLLGIPGAVAFCSLILAGLRTWWIDAVGTTAIVLDVSASSLAIGAAAGLAAALMTTVLSLRALRGAEARTLIAGGPVVSARARERLLGLTYRAWAWGSGAAAAGLISAAALQAIPPAAGFFGAGSLLLIASLLFFSASLRRPVRSVIHTPGLAGVLRLGARQTRWRPARSVLVAALVAAATFVIVAVGAFRREAVVDPRAPESGTGGFPLFAESVIPLMHDPSTADGRRELGFAAADEPILHGSAIARFRLRPGDESSCLNLYRPASPRILAPSPSFLRQDRFQFQSVLEGSERERANPWLLLDRTFDDGAVPVIGDATSLAYVLHAGIGDELTVPGDDGEPIVLRVVAALSHSMLQSELIVSERQFVRLFPRREGFRFFLIDAPAPRQAEVARLLEDRFADAGLDVQSSLERLRAYERVERTYLSTFQTLGGLGLVIGTLGLGAVLLRNVLERRRELALLAAIGYRRSHVRGLVLAESLVLLGTGVLAGLLSAVLAVAPAWWSRGGGGPGWIDTAVLLVIVAAVGVASSMIAARAAASAAPVSALRSE